MQRILTIVALAVIAIQSAYSQTKPVFHNYEYDDQTIIQGMSDNGKWAVASGGEAAAARLINLDTQEATVISTTAKSENAQDVTDDGKIVVGSANGKPAFYNTSTSQWTNLQTQSPYIYGNVYSVTPDGKYAVGVLYYSDGYYSRAAMWDLSTAKLVTTEGLPTKDMGHEDKGQMDFRKISADGKKILGCMSFSYLPTSEDNGGCFFFVYDVDNKSYKPIGFTETTSGRWTPKTEGLIVVMSATMSNNGKYVTGGGHMAFDVEGSNYANEYQIPFLYNTETDTYTSYDETYTQDTYGSAVSNTGALIDVSPEGTPVREWSTRYGKYWFSFAEILKQKYNTTIEAQTTYDNTGTVNNISDDGKRLVSFPDPYKSYVVDLSVAVEKLGEGIKLLGSYAVSPVEGSEVSHLKNIQVTFDRKITAVGGSNSAEIQFADGTTVYNSVGFNAEGKTLSIRFRTGTMQAGDTYKLFIPEGTVALADDATQTNNDIYVTYKGRADEAVKVVETYPTEGTAFSHIDYATSPVVLTFDTNILITDTATAKLYRNDEAEAFCSLTLARSGKKLALYPSTSQYLYDGSTYRVVVDKGAVTDMAGNNPNEEISVGYAGNYIRTISPDDIILFSDNFDNGYSNFMMWCGDQHTPTDEMVNWDFQKGMAWGLVRDSESSGDRMAASHSMYSPAGQSDDWLVIPQIYVPDMLCSVKFLSQSYKKNKNDMLKVVVWESNNVYNTLTEDIINKMKAEGVVVYNEKQNPGEQEEVLGGEWTENSISLADFAEKNIYIAFVNENYDQSAIFMDSLVVRHDMHYLTNLNYEESVVNKESVAISGLLIGNNADAVYNNVTIELKDAEGNVVDTYTATGMNLAKDAKHAFAFEKPLPLTVGVENKFSLHVDVDGEENEVKGSIKDLAFQPTKRIVLEEYTGRACGNCPLGIIAIEKLEAMYGNQFIPISIHTYNNDPLSYGMGSYSSALGIDQLGAPSGIINRGTGCYPAASVDMNDYYRFFFTHTDPDYPNGSEEAKLWMDYAMDEMAVPAECDITISDVTYNASNGEMTADCDIRYALNASNLTMNIFTVLLEDNLSQKQSNYMASISSPDLGEWGLGGRYGQSVVDDYLHQDVCRNVNGLTINGTGGYVPSTVVAGEVYNAKVSVAVPSTVQSLGECKVVVMMIDANTGKVINAARGKYVDPTGIETIENEQMTIDNSAIYNTAGQRVGAGYKGIIIRNGKKILVR